jgi:hypothetical protein
MTEKRRNRTTTQPRSSFRARPLGYIRKIDYCAGNAPPWRADLGQMRTLVETIASVDAILEFIEKHDLDHDILRAP